MSNFATKDQLKSIVKYMSDNINIGYIAPSKFDKGNLYNTEEKIVGQWIDGKPIYQKTIDCGSLTNKTSKKISINVENIDKIVNQFGFAFNSSGQILPLPYPHTTAASSIILDIRLEDSDWKLNIGSGSDRSSFSAYVTLQYTKTTDSAIAIGDENDYSTDEKIIGTWIDGKPVYQKTIDFGALPNATTKNVAHNISDIDKKINIFGYAFSSTGQLPLPYIDPSQLSNSVNVNFDETNVFIKTASNRTTYTETYVTIQYTKTTD